MSRRLRVTAVAAIGALTGLGVVSFGCTGDPPEPQSRGSATRLAEPADVLDEPLMVALAQAKNFHHKADVHLQDGDPARAIASLRAILTIPFPAGAAEAQDVLLDARARLAKLLLGAGDAREALRVIDEGIAAAARPSFFLANLHTVRGEVLEAQARALASSDDAAATALRRQAIDAYDQSIRINEAIQRRLVEELAP